MSFCPSTPRGRRHDLVPSGLWHRVGKVRQRHPALLKSLLEGRLWAPCGVVLGTPEPHAEKGPAQLLSRGRVQKVSPVAPSRSSAPGDLWADRPQSSSLGPTRPLQTPAPLERAPSRLWGPGWGSGRPVLPCTQPPSAHDRSSPGTQTRPRATSSVEKVSLGPAAAQVRDRHLPTPQGYQWLKDKILSEEGRRQQAKLKELQAISERLGCTLPQLAIGDRAGQAGDPPQFPGRGEAP